MIATASEAARIIKGLSYYPNFISLEEKSHINSIIHSRSWCDRLRRRQQYYGIKYFQTKFNDQVLQNKESHENENHFPLTDLQWIIDRMTNDFSVFEPSYPPNQCLINRYLKHDALGMHVEDK